MNRIPSSLAPFFPEYDLQSLDLHQSAATIIERTLRFGNRAELRWLFTIYPGRAIDDWLQRWGQYALPEPHLYFWKLVLGRQAQAGGQSPGEVHHLAEQRSEYPASASPPVKPLYWETVSPTMRQVMDAFGRTAIGACFYLAGGTALALQLGHRRSEDLDFFTPTEDVPAIRQTLQDALKEYSPSIVDASWGNLLLLAASVRLGFYTYGFSLVAPLVPAGAIQLASLADIGLMKLDALMSRASRKDFHDLYAICQQMPLRALLDLAPHKYPNARDFEAQVARHLVFFDRAEAEAPLPLLHETSWETVKDFFRSQAAALFQSWLE